MLKQNQLIKLILGLAALLTVVITVITFFVPASIYPDPSWGFRVMHCMQNGGGFNMLSSVGIGDVSKTDYAFLSWWSPGQYLVPGFFIALFKLTIGQAGTITSGICSLVGLAGLYIFFKKAGFSPLISALSILFIACQQFYITPFSFYNGGEVLLFAFTGWFLYGCISFDKADWASALFLLVSGLVGFFCKSAFMWMLLSGALLLWIRVSLGKKQLSAWIINGIWTAVPVVLSVAIIYLGYLSKGDNPASEGMGIKLTWETFSFPIASPLLAGFSVDDLLDGVLANPPAVPLSTILLLQLLAVASIALIICIIRFVPQRNYQLLIAVFYGLGVLFFSVNFLRQANISYEARHMRVIGLMVIPGVLYLVGKLKLPWQALFACIWIFLACKSYMFAATGYQRDTIYTAHGHTGISQLFIDQPTLNYINQLDDKEHNAIFVFTSVEVSLEVQHNRIIVFDAGAAEDDMNTYTGHAGPVYLLLPASDKADQIGIYTRRFPGYAKFEPVFSTKYYVIYKGFTPALSKE